MGKNGRKKHGTVEDDNLPYDGVDDFSGHRTSSADPRNVITDLYSQLEKRLTASGLNDGFPSMQKAPDDLIAAFAKAWAAGRNVDDIPDGILATDAIDARRDVDPSVRTAANALYDAVYPYTVMAQQRRTNMVANHEETFEPFTMASPEQEEQLNQLGDVIVDWMRDCVAARGRAAATKVAQR